MNEPNHFVSRAFAAIFALSLLVCRPAVAVDTYAGQTVVISLKRPARVIASQNPNVEYSFDPQQEKFLVHVPAKYTGNEPYGVFVFLSPQDKMNELPPGWADILEKRKLIFICPLKAGNDVAINRRLGIAIFAAVGAERQWKIDTTRVYVGGFSGGARMANMLGFYAPDIFAGSIQMCGADYFKAVPQVEGKPLPRDTTPYGMNLAGAQKADIDAAKKSFRFAFITGENDFRHGHIRDIYNGGYAKDGFQCTLFDVPGMDHEVCPPRILNQALDFVANIKTAAATRSAAPAWMAKDPSQWPQILLRNHVIERSNAAGTSGSACFTRLTSGVVVVATAGHLLEHVNPADFSAAYKSWIAFPMLQPPSIGVPMTRVAMDVTVRSPMDVLFLCPRSQHERWPAAILPIREEPLETGETVYLIAVPHAGTTRQNVYKGIVIRHEDDHQVQYNIDATFDTMGCSGAPVIDEMGQLAGINVAHLDNQNIPGKLQLVCIDAAAALTVIKLPPDLTPAAAESRPTIGSATVASENSAGFNKQADDALHGVRIYIDNKLYAKARVKLQDIIAAYPASDAAKKARQMLSELPDK